MKIMVLGGAGFIGSAFVRELNSRKIKPLVFDLLTYACRLENLSGTDYDFVKGDIRDSKLHDVIASFRPEIIVNFAAETHVDRSIYKPQDFVTTNILGTVNILEALRLYNFKYVHVSTDEVYGEECADENSPLNPSSPYSASKASADLLVKSYVRTYNVEAIIVRPSNNYGPRQFPEKFIPKTIIRTLLGLHVPIYGDGKQERDWIYVEDTAKIIADLLSKAEWKGNVYNLPGGQRVTNIEIIKLLEEIMNRKIEVRFVSDRPGHDKRYCMINTKLRYTSTTLADGLRKVYEWYINNRWWWESLISNKFFREDEPWKTV
ncbi:NAD-dependent epimerase/dehydratase family protein [Sulfolobus islandicus]|uniref:NAD-dependent epimerase/dehydratase n=1 Tax=Saccharolobus islandicus (strain HVE10/4) TaxID=930943 RepID=F0NJE3_SACI0|nr:dTDP-glucose 4,6-dehydratase [Sulfolobus islandicus]ADX81808.1 NAD-dependent epimerase/dehydratase [Sulfolobus islandicus HVE10/4]WCM36835.1 NAD-dependent epimerase/dehydratase family protein [Sulfolobus islandicus]